MRKKIGRQGNHELKTDQSVLFDLPMLYGTTWVMYSRHSQAFGDYLNVKLVAVGRCADKANYWLAWHIPSQSFSSNKCWRVMQEHRPDMAALVVEYMKLFA